MWVWHDEPVADTASERWRWEEKPVDDLYALLAVQRSATAEEIRRAYRRLAQKLHPDLRPSEEQAVAAEEMAALNVAYSTLSDPVRRAAYDQSHGFDEQPFSV